MGGIQSFRSLAHPLVMDWNAGKEAEPLPTPTISSHVSFNSLSSFVKENSMEGMGDSEDNSWSTESGASSDRDDDDDAESCINGDSGGGGDRECISWRMWCILEHEAAASAKWRGSGSERTMSNSSFSTAEDAEENRLFWEACLANESPLPPLF